MNPQIIRRAKVNRLRLGLSLDELAAETGLSRGYLSEWERGIRRFRPDQERRVEEALARHAEDAQEAPHGAA